MNWRRNLAALWFAEFTAIFGFSFAFPFLSIFINQDLGVRTGSDLYLDSRVSKRVGIALAIASPVWGSGDRFGCKPMLVRSMVGVRLLGLIYWPNPTELVVPRFCRPTSGTVAAPPRWWRRRPPTAHRLGAGVVTSAVALEVPSAPWSEGFAGAVFGLRVAPFASGGPCRWR